MSASRQPGAPKQPSPITEETLRQLLAVQEKKIQLDLRQTEIALREIDHNQKIADLSIQAQAQDRQHERAMAKTMHLHRLVFAAVVIALVLVFAAAALLMDKDAVVLDMAKIILGFVGGWGASLAWQRGRRPSAQDDSAGE